jgi:hypothetical protein
MFIITKRKDNGLRRRRPRGTPASPPPSAQRRPPLGKQWPKAPPVVPRRGWTALRSGRLVGSQPASLGAFGADGGITVADDLATEVGALLSYTGQACNEVFTD